MRSTALALLLCGLAVDHTCADSERVLLSTDRLTVELDRTRHGAIVSLTDTATGMQFVNDRVVQDLFAIEWTRTGDQSGKRERLASHDAEQIEWESSADRLIAVFRRLGGQDITVTCTATSATGQGDVRWSLSITGAAPLTVEAIHYPILALRAPLEDTGNSDAIVAGYTKGGVFHEPAQWDVGQGLSLAQPGPLAAQFSCYYSPRSGLLTYTRDARGYPKVFACLRTNEGLTWSWERRCYQPLNQPLELGYEISMTTFSGQTPGDATDWRDAADIYKQWALQQPWCAVPYAQRADIPEWMKTGPSMIRFYRQWLATPQRVEDWLHDYWQKYFPETPLIVALWGWERVDSWISPKYFPPYPSEADFTRTVNAIQQVGGHAFPWPSGYYWNVEYQANADGTFAWQDWDDFNATGLPHALLQRDGTPLVRKLPWLNGGRNAVLCRGDAWTRQWFNKTAVTLMQLGCDMLQVDQVVGGRAPGEGNCFSTEHGHPPGPGVWDTEAFTAQLQSLAAECRRIQPAAVLAIEEPQELFNHLIGVQDYRDAQSDRWPNLPGVTHASIFGYLYHEFLPVFQSNPHRGNQSSLAYCAVTGQIPHWIPHWPVHPSPALANGNFEEWTADAPADWGRVTGWQGTVYSGKAFRDEAVKAEGAASVRLENQLATEIVQVSQNVPVGPGRLQVGHTYRLRARIKVDHLARSNAINLAALTPDLGSKGAWHIPFPAPGEWTERSVEFTMPAEAAFLRIMLHVVGPCQLWIDDVRLESQIDGQWQPLMQPGLPPEHAFITQWVELFHGAGRPYLLLGTMIHPPQLIAPVPEPGERAPFPAIMLNAYRAPDGSEAAIVANATDKVQQVQFRWHDTTRTLELPPWSLRLVN